MIKRLSVVIYWLGIMFCCLGVIFAFIFPIIIWVSNGGIDFLSFIFAIGMAILIFIGSFAMFGIGWAVRFIVTGTKRLFP